jgi:ATP-binding cassette subfamily F protein 3
MQTSIQKGIQHARSTGDDKVLGMVASRKKKLDRFGVEKRDDGKRWRSHTRRFDETVDGFRKQVEEVQDAPLLVFEFDPPPPMHYQGAVLQARNVSYAYMNAAGTGRGPTVISNVVLDVPRNARIGVIG